MSDVELLSAPDPASSPEIDLGVFGAALSALRHAAAQANKATADVPASESVSAGSGSTSPKLATTCRASRATRRDAAAEVALIVYDTSTRGVSSAFPPALLTAGAALVAPAYPLITRREMRAQSEVAESRAGPEFDAAKEAELLKWMIHGASEEVPFSGQRVLSMR